MKAFTIKSLIFGLIGLAVVCVFPDYSGLVLGLSDTVQGYLPAVPLLIILFLSLAWNMTIGRLSRKLALNSKELAVVMGLMLVTSWIPTLQHDLIRHLVLPRYEEMSNTNASWKDAGLTSRLPDPLFPAGPWELLGSTEKDAPTWWHTSFEPKTKPADSDHNRYRAVDPPDRLKAWYEVDYDPAKNGWKQEQRVTLNGETPKRYVVPEKWLARELPKAGEVVFVRKEFDLKDLNFANLRMTVYSRQAYDVYLNGRRIVATDMNAKTWRARRSYCDGKMKEALKVGRNVVAVESFPQNSRARDGGIDVFVEKYEYIDETVHFGFIQGHLPAKDIPYKAWYGPILRWMPLLLILVLSLIALTFIVHRQWTVHEQLRYPLASVIDAVIHQDDRRPGGTLFRNRLFWFSCLFVFGFHLWRYLNGWFPGKMPKLSAEYVLEWSRLFPIMGADRSNATFFVVHWMPISFAVLGIAYFVPADVSLSMGLTAPLGTLLGIQYYVATGNPVSSTGLEVIRSGGFIAFAIILVYTGRAYYFPVFAKAIMPWRGKVEDLTAVWAARVFLLGYFFLIFVLSTMGVDLLVAWVIVTLVLLVFLVVTRLVCETGLPSFAPAWSLPGLMTGLFGPGAIGAAPLAFVTLLGRTIISADSTNLFMPYMATSLKVLDDNHVNLRRFAVVAKIAIVLTLVAGFVAALHFSYTNGEGNLSKSERGYLSKAVYEILNLKDTGQLEAAATTHGLAKVKLIRPDSGSVRLVVVGMIAVLATYMLRFRFAKWPLHPLFFVVLGSRAGRFTWFCFLLGWGIKSLVVKFGGGRGYRNLKPLFIGFIVGETLILGLTFVVGTIYYMKTGNQPVALGLYR